MPRQYNKRNKGYWSEMEKPRNQSTQIQAASPQKTIMDIQALAPEMAGGGHQIEINAGYCPDTETRRRFWEVGAEGFNVPQIRFPNVYAGILPYQNIHSCIGVADAVELSQKAWANIAIVRNTIEAMVQFSCSKLHLKCKNENAKKTCEAWLKRIKINDFQQKFFRELYRSGNVFNYRIIGRLKKSLMDDLKTTFGYELGSNEIVVGYVILNPVNVAVKNGGIGLYQSYIKFLTSLELNTLKNNEFGREMLRQMGIDEEKLKNAPYPHIFLEFDSNKIVPVFYQKQDYEPLAIPPLWSIMDDLELKLKMKRADEAVVMTVENIILLVTAGSDPDKGGVDPNYMGALKEMFQNRVAGRVLVANYTTKAEFIIPDLKRVLGKEKYEQVNADIREGLQSLIMGDEKFSNSMTKAKLFLEKLESSREQFKTFIEDEIEAFCNMMKFRDIPEVEQEVIDLEDKTQADRVITQLVQFGILTPEEGFEAMRSGIFPTPDQSLKDQQEYRKQRDKRLFTPLAPEAQPSDGDGGGKQAPSPMKQPVGRQPGAKGPITKKKKVPIIGEENGDAVLNENGEQIDLSELEQISMASVIATMKNITQLGLFVKEKFKDKYKVDADEKFAQEITSNIVENSEQEDWTAKVTEVLDNQTELKNEEIQAEVESIKKQYDTGNQYLANLIYHSLKLGI